MATQAHCAYCFESLAASLEKRSTLSLREVEVLWRKHTSNSALTAASLSEAEASKKPAAVSRLLSPSPGSTSSSSLQSGGSSTPSSATSATTTSSTSSGSLLSKLTGRSKSSSCTTTTEEEEEDEEDTEDDEDEEEHPLFVTWNTIRSPTDKRLRGCIGTFEPHSLSSGLRSYALTSAFDDTRFSPISLRELPTLECAVTLLTDFEPAKDNMDWEIGVHGLRISFTERGRRYGATYLPDVAKEQGWNKEETLISLMRKAGWSGRKEGWTDIDVNVVRYQGKKVSLGYKEWKTWRDWLDEEMEAR